jgi:hypothetical protein
MDARQRERLIADIYVARIGANPDLASPEISAQVAIDYADFLIRKMDAASTAPGARLDGQYDRPGDESADRG